MVKIPTTAAFGVIVMEAIYGKSGSGKTTFFKKNNPRYEEKTAESEQELKGLLSYSNSSEFRNELIPLLINVWYDFDYRTFKKEGVDFTKYPLVTIECHKKCIAALPIKVHHINGGMETEIFEIPLNRDLFPLIGYKVIYWNNEDRKYMDNGIEYPYIKLLL